jgi:hypothetical protein
MELRWLGCQARGNPMSDVAYLRKLAERYRRLARSFEHAAVRDCLEELAEELEQKVRELQRSLSTSPAIH